MSDEAQDWLRLPPGSPEALVANFLAPSDGRRFRALAGLRNAVFAAASANEPVVSAAKIGWWRQELERLGQCEARHPVTVELQRQLAGEPELFPLLNLIPDAAEVIARQEQPQSIEALRTFCYRSHGIVLAASAPGAAADGPCRAFARHVGIATALAGIVADLAVGRHRFLMPAGIGARTGLGSGDESSGESDQTVIRTLVDFGLAELCAASPVPRGAAAATTILLDVTRGELESRGRRPSRPAHPLQSLWRAWRAARRHAAHNR